MYAKPATVAPPAMAGILSSFEASLGRARAKDIVRTAGRLCIEYDPAGQPFVLDTRGPTVLRRMPFLEKL